MDKIKIQILKEFEGLFDKDYRYLIYYGGRNSGKSYQVALALLLRGRAEKLRILCTREIQNTIKDSVHKLLKDLINKYQLNDYRVTIESITNIVTGTEFFFKGLKRNTAEIKSMEGVDICWIEEGQSITDESLDILTPTIRKEGSQIIVTFNRFTELDPVYVKYVINQRPKSLVKKVNFDVLEELGLLNNTIKQEIDYDREHNPELYTYKWLGEPLGQADNATISRTDIMEAMSREVTDEGQTELGVDVARMGDDRTVLWKRKGHKTIGFKVYQKKRTTEICDLIEGFVDKETIIKVDDTGVGCITNDAKILTPSGWIKANNIKPNQSIYSQDKNGNVVVEKVISISKRITEILESNGYKYSWSHLVPYKTRLDNQEKLKSWQEVLNNKQVIFKSDFNYQSNDEDVRLSEQVITMPNGGQKIIRQRQKVNIKLFAELLGWYVSEGCFENNNYCIKITQKPNQYRKRIIEIMAHYGKVQIKGNDISIFNKPLYDWLKFNCYNGGYGFKYKTVPRYILNSSREVIDIFLEAFCRGDGYYHYDSRYYVTSSVNLVDDLIEAIYKLGKKAGSYKKYEAGSIGYIKGRKIIRTEDNWVVFECKNNKCGYHYGLKPTNTTTYKGEVYSLIISGDSRLMFTKINNLKPIWSHNGGVTDEMIKRGYSVVAINFGGEPADKDKYSNLISEAWFYLKDLIKEIELPNDRDLLMELSTRQWKQDSRGRRCIESKTEYKKRGFRSPDLADACIIAYYNPQIIEPDIHFI